MNVFTQVLLSVLILVIAPFLLKKLRCMKEYTTLMDKFLGPKPSLIFGSISEYIVSRENLSAVFDRRFKTYGPVIRVWNLTYYYADLFISKPEYLEVILSSTKHIKKNYPYERIKPWLGTGLLTSTGRKWHLHRKLLTPTFHLKILEQFFEVFVDKSNLFVNKLKQLPANKVVDLMPLISKCTLDIICGLEKRLAFLDLLLETQENCELLTDKDIQDEMDTFMFEGHDTTAMAITWTLYLLGRHPHIQDAVALELDSILISLQHNPVLDDLADMKYLDRVIKESLRLYPSVPFVGRKFEESLSLSEDFIIPAGSSVILDIFHTHRNPDHFPDPETFNPDNFLPEQIRERHPFAYIPFSAGPRNCIGQKFALMEEKTVLCSILRHFKVEAVENNISILQELTTKPANGLLVKLTPRVKN